MRNLFISLFLMLSIKSFAQLERKFIRSGNEAFLKNEFGNAEVEYQKAIEKNETSLIANYNRGNALYKQNKYDDAIKQFDVTSKLSDNSKADASVFHNLGNSYMQKQDYENAIKAYKESLKRNPDDKQTKYNLAYANQKLKQSQQNQQQDNKDQNQDQKDKQDQKQDQKEDQNKQQQNKENQDQNDKKQNPQNLSKEQANQLLKAIENDEKKLQEKLMKQKNQSRKIKTEKDW